MTIIELRAKRNKAWEAAKEFAETHRTPAGTLSAEDEATYNALEKQIMDYGREIQRMERQEAIDAELAKPVTAPITGRPGNQQEEKKTGRASDEYRQAVLAALRSNFRKVSNVLSEGVDAQGGYLVPEEYDRRLIDVLTEENIMRNLGTKITTSGEHKINIAATKPAAAWIEEGGALTFGDATFDQIIMDAHKLHVAIKVTEELLYDNAFNLENYIITQFGKALANAEEDAFLNGDGVGKPLGLLAAEGGAEVGVTAASATAITADELVDLFYSLDAPYRTNAVWLVNDSTMRAIRKLKDANGQYLWQKALHEGDHETLLGKPIFHSPFAPELGAGKKAVAFGDFSFYWIGDRTGITFRRLNERYADTGQVGFLATKRVDGKLILPEAVKVLQMKAA